MHYIYKLSRIAITAMLLTYTPLLFGQTITMKSVQAGGEMSLSLATHSDNSTVTIDWGMATKRLYHRQGRDGMQRPCDEANNHHNGRYR